jgi:ketosteroid isomerase-like protein
MLILTVPADCASVRAGQQRAAERYIVEGARQWAESVATGDVSALERILAEDFVGVGPGGRPYDKATALADTRSSAKDYVSNRLNAVRVRFYGDGTAVARGHESWERRTGEPRRGRFVWTDTRVRRNGRWQIVAAQDATVPDPPR